MRSSPALRAVLAPLLFVGLSAVATGAQALSFSLTEDGCTGSCGTGPYGTVDVVQGVDANTVDFTVTLNSPSKFVSTGGPHHAFVFSIAGDPAITIADLPDGFEVGDAPASNAPFGDFSYSIDCPGCGPGASHAKPGPLTFTVSLAGGLSPGDFVANDGGFIFSADIIGPSGNTGNVAALVPEPATAFLLVSGLIGLTAAGRRRS
jgi:hypothetical protein